MKKYPLLNFFQANLLTSSLLVPETFCNFEKIKIRSLLLILFLVQGYPPNFAPPQ